MSVPNVLATRYASEQMRAIWSPENKIVAERRLWIAVLKAQKDLGVDFGGDDPATVIADYQRVVDQVDLEAVPLDFPRPRGIVVRFPAMLAAVDFDDQAVIDASEVGAERADGDLTTEFVAAQLTIAEPLP